MAYSRKAHVNPAMVTTALADVLPSAATWDSKCVIVLDVSHVPEPRSIETRMHNGLHPYIMKMMCDATHFDALIAKAVGDMKHAISKSYTSFVFVCVDKLGRYASLALGKALAEIAVADEFLTLNKVTVLSRETDLECGPCDRCTFWDRRFVDKNRAVATMINKWNDCVRRPTASQ